MGNRNRCGTETVEEFEQICLETFVACAMDGSISKGVIQIAMYGASFGGDEYDRGNNPEAPDAGDTHPWTQYLVRKANVEFNANIAKTFDFNEFKKNLQQAVLNEMLFGKTNLTKLAQNIAYASLMWGYNSAANKAGA